MWPVVGSFGGFELHTWGLLGALGFLVVAGGGLARCRELGIRLEHAADALIAVGVAGILGARLLFVLTVGGAGLLDLRSGGASFFGAVLAAIPAGTLVARWRGLPIGSTWDAFTSAVPFGFALSRLGCLAAGCCYGRPSDLPWAVALHGDMRHPTQLYEALWQILLGVALNARWGELKTRPGALTLLWILGTGAGRLVIEIFRGDPGRGAWGPLSVPQWMGLGLIGVAAAGLARLRR